MLLGNANSFDEKELRQEIAKRTSPFFIVEDMFFNNSNFVTNSYFREFMVSLVHFIVVGIPAIPLIVVAVVYWNSHIKWTDPDVPNKYIIPQESLAALIIALIYTIIALIKLFIYYINYNVNRRHIIPRAAFRLIYYIALIIVSFASLTYVLLVILWIVLGSFVNPDTVLPYLIAVGAIFLQAILFAAGKTKLLKSVKKQLDEELIGFIKDLGIHIPAIHGVEKKSSEEEKQVATKKRTTLRKSNVETKKIEPKTPTPHEDKKDEDKKDEEDREGDGDEEDTEEEEVEALFGNASVTDAEMKEQMREFKIIKKILNKNVMVVLNDMGLSAKKILGAIIAAVATLGIFFVFLFIGFESFAGNGAGSTAVKSGLTAVVGLIMSKGSGESGDEQTLQIRSNQLVKQIMKRLKLKKEDIKKEIELNLPEVKDNGKLDFSPVHNIV